MTNNYDLMNNSTQYGQKRLSSEVLPSAQLQMNAVFNSHGNTPVEIKDKNKQRQASIMIQIEE